jgi:hypothetical protein
VRDFYVDKVIAPLAASKDIDGVFFDCFNFAYDMPNPWNRNAVNIPNCTHGAGGAGCGARRRGQRNHLPTGCSGVLGIRY